MSPEHLTNYLVNQVTNLIDDVAENLHEAVVTLDGRTTTSPTVCTQTATIDGRKVRITVEVNADNARPHTGLLPHAFQTTEHGLYCSACQLPKANAVHA